MPALEKAAAAQIIAGEQEAQLAKGRRKPVTTNVARYVGAKAPAVSRALAKILAHHAKRVAAIAANLYHQRLQKDDTSDREQILALIEELNLEDLGVDINGELTTAMAAAITRAASLGLTQVGIDESGDITAQVDVAAVAWADEHGGELIKNLAGTTADAVQALLSRAVDEGMSSDELSAAIEGMGAFSESRADTIARTELAYAHVQGNVEGWRQSNEVEGKRWILADTHPEPDECDDAADAGVVGLDEDFGDGIDFPPAHPNCLCDVLPVLRETTDAADSGDTEGE
jgi:hypothetical protein